MFFKMCYWIIKLFFLLFLEIMFIFDLFMFLREISGRLVRLVRVIKKFFVFIVIYLSIL